MKFTSLLVLVSAVGAIDMTKHHRHYHRHTDNIDLMSNVDLNARLNARAWERMGVKSHQEEIKELNDAVSRLEKLTGEADTDPDWND